MRIRKEIRTLNDDELDDFIKAMLALRKQGKYDKYVHWHHAVMVPTVYPNEP